MFSNLYQQLIDGGLNYEEPEPVVPAATTGVGAATKQPVQPTGLNTGIDWSSVIKGIASGKGTPGTLLSYGTQKKPAAKPTVVDQYLQKSATINPFAGGNYIPELAAGGPGQAKPEKSYYYGNPFAPSGQATKGTGGIGNLRSDFANWYYNYYGHWPTVEDLYLQNQPLGWASTPPNKAATATKKSSTYYKPSGGYPTSNPWGSSGGYTMPKWFLDMIYWRI